MNLPGLDRYQGSQHGWLVGLTCTNSRSCWFHTVLWLLILMLSMV